MNDPMKDATDALERWFDTLDIPQEAIEEISLMMGGYFAVRLIERPEPTQEMIMLTELGIAIFNLGRAHAHEKLK